MDWDWNVPVLFGFILGILWQKMNQWLGRWITSKSGRTFVIVFIYAFLIACAGDLYKYITG